MMVKRGRKIILRRMKVKQEKKRQQEIKEGGRDKERK